MSPWLFGRDFADLADLNRKGAVPVLLPRLPNFVLGGQLVGHIRLSTVAGARLKCRISHRDFFRVYHYLCHKLGLVLFDSG